MCGIVGYVGKRSSRDVILQGLKKLEYRGYDSCGMATITQQKFEIVKSTKRVEALEKMTEKNHFSTIGIGHTRWATHGAPNEKNAHPQVDCKKRFAVVHNGIIENNLELKQKLKEEGFSFFSDTDTEVIPNLLSYYFSGDVKEAIGKGMQKMKGSFAIGILEVEHPNTLFVAKRKSPLMIGVKEGEKIVASDFCAIAEYTNQVYLLEDDEMAEITSEKVMFYDSHLKPIRKKLVTIETDVQDMKLGAFQHYMQKEIYENPIAVRKTLELYFDENRQICLPLSPYLWKDCERITIVACGTAMHAGLTAKYTIEELTGIPVSVEVASEFRYHRFILTQKDFVILISQSGETADTIAALELVKENGVKHLSLVNVPNSTLARMSEYTLYTQAGVEVAVASTKAYIAQVTLLSIVALEFARQKGAIANETEKQFVDELFFIPNQMESILEEEASFEAYAEEIKEKKSMFFMGRGMDYYAVLEGSLKLKEISYIHSEAYQAGELKHGTIALIEEGTKVIAVCTDEKLLPKMISNIKEVVSRGAEVVFLTNCEKEVEPIFEKRILIPKTSTCFSPLLSVIPMQLLAYYTTVKKGFDVDKPRNLAKSVTVE